MNPIIELAPEQLDMLRDQMRIQHVSQRKLSTRTGLVQPRICRLFRRKEQGSLRTWQRIANALGMHFSVEVRLRGLPARKDNRKRIPAPRYVDQDTLL